MNPERERYEDREREFAPARGRRGPGASEGGRSGWDPELSYSEMRARGYSDEREGRGDGRQSGAGHGRGRWEGGERYAGGERSWGGRRQTDEWSSEPGPYSQSWERAERGRGEWGRRGQDDPGAYGSEAWYGSERRGGRLGRSESGEDYGEREGGGRQAQGRGQYSKSGGSRGAYDEYGSRSRGFEPESGRWGELGRRPEGERRWEGGGRESGPFVGRGPKGYQRSDERLREDVCERLTQHGDIDASEIEVRVENGEVTLTGTVDDRQSKRLAEDIVDAVPGVKQVQNQLRISGGGRAEHGASGGRSEHAGASAGSTSRGSATGSESRTSR
jgi:osmotically-inducible protein OsmY